MPAHMGIPFRRKDVRIYFRRDVFARTLIFVGRLIISCHRAAAGR